MKKVKYMNIFSTYDRITMPIPKIFKAFLFILLAMSPLGFWYFNFFITKAHWEILAIKRILTM